MMKFLKTIQRSQKIQDRWNLALNLLQPTEEELNQGLELHYDSLVAESYSLGLHAPVDPDLLNARIEEHLTPLEFKDFSEDQAMLNWISSQDLREQYSELWKHT